MARNFDLRPDLVTYPLPLLSASAAVPTAVDLYVNNVRQFSGQARGGPFVLNAAPAVTGAGQAVIVVKDALGRDVVTSVPLYIDTGLLAAGLSDYAVEAGFLRNQYGVHTFDYARSPALSASLRYGLSGSLTLESHAEAARGLANLGAGMRTRLGQAGVVSGAASVARGGDASGAQGSLGYQYRAPGIAIDLQGTRTFGTYQDLASTAGAPFYRSLLRGTVSRPVGRTGSVALSYIGLSVPGSDRSRIVSLSYAALLGRDLSLSASAYQDLADSRAAVCCSRSAWRWAATPTPPRASAAITGVPRPPSARCARPTMPAASAGSSSRAGPARSAARWRRSTTVAATAMRSPPCRRSTARPAPRWTRPARWC